MIWIMILMTHKKDKERDEVKIILILHFKNIVFKMEMEKRQKIEKQTHEANQLKDSNLQIKCTST